jgi:hypothetical protein
VAVAGLWAPAANASWSEFSYGIYSEVSRNMNWLTSRRLPRWTGVAVPILAFPAVHLVPRLPRRLLWSSHCFKPANLFFPNFQRKRFKIKQIGRIKSVYLANLCTRHIPNKLTPRGHEDWPVKRATRKLAAATSGIGGLRNSTLGLDSVPVMSPGLCWVARRNDRIAYRYGDLTLT